MSIHVKTAAGWEELGVSGGGAPGAAVIGGATADDPLYPVNKSSFTGDGTNGDLGQAYDVYEFLGSGELVVDDDGAGFADVLVIAAGGSSNVARDELKYTHQTGGGGGGMLELGDVYLESGPHTVVVGAGASGEWANGSGTNSKLGTFVAYGGGGGAYGSATIHGVSGGSGSGSTGDKARTGQGLENQGNDGGQVLGAGKVFGGGAGGAGSNSSAGAGKDSYITGSKVTYAEGGDTNTANTVNSGNARGGNGAGNSGIVIARVKVASESYPFRTKTTAPRTAHAARIEDGIVREVIVIPHLDDDDQKITEYCNRIGLPGTWVDTSYLGARRGKHAGVGDEFRHEGRSGEGEFVSPGVEEPEPEPEAPEGAYKFETGTSTSPAAGKCRFYSSYLMLNKTDSEGEVVQASAGQIMRVQVPSQGFDDTSMVMDVNDSTDPKVKLYRVNIPDYSDVNSAGVETFLTLTNNVAWTDQVVPVYDNSTSNVKDYLGYMYRDSTNGKIRFNQRDKDGNFFPVFLPGMRLRYYCAATENEKFFRVMDVEWNGASNYIAVTPDQMPHFSVFKDATLEVVE